ncbi:MAG: hypothetical protein U0797_05485 [Gemmataceae bacterium]
MPRRLSLLLAAALVLTSTPFAGAQPEPQRIRLFRFQPGFLSDVPWLDTDTRPGESAPAEPAGPDLDWVNVSAGNDNPYFDLRKPGDPGGLGFARVNTQVQLWETERTAFALGVQAVTPLGLQSVGLGDHDGPTVLSPALSLFHVLDEGLALQAFVGKNLPVMNAATRPVRREVQYGLALQQALSTEGSDPLSCLFVSVGALGQGDPSGRRINSLEVLPGLHWQPAQTWWMSAGYALPVGPARGDPPGQWQLTCSWQY